MGKLSKIEWTDHTWSPWWGCTKVDRGCKLCYAQSLAKRMGFNIWGQDVGRRNLSVEHWEQPFKWNEEAGRLGINLKVFPSMCDPFEVRDDLKPTRRRFFELIKWTPNLQWLLLTKRPEEIDWYELPANAHVLASVNDMESFAKRIEWIRRRRRSSNRVHGLSIEPLTGPLDICKSDLYGIDWAIVGGETGHSAARMMPQWVQRIRVAASDAGTKFLFKQWGHGALIEDRKNFAHLERVREWPAQLGPAVTKK